jgi:ribosomal protein S18 acetylase RimI-like enzyme
LTFEKVSKPKKDDLESLRKSLKAFNDSITGEYEEKEIAAFMKNFQGVIVGGIYGKLTAGWLYIDWLWVHDELRHCQIGSKLLKLMEDYAIGRGITKCHLETTNFQALDFYRKNGFEIFGKLNDKPPGHISCFLKKKLNQSSRIKGI